MIKIELERVDGDYGFEAKDANGHTVRLDTSVEGGGTNFGVRPMQMLLMGLGGCSGIDIVSILNKQRQTIEGFHMTIEGEREKGKEPTLWETITIHFLLKGQIDPDKQIKAGMLSMDKYGSVAAPLREARATITWEVSVNGQSVYSCPAGNP